MSILTQKTINKKIFFNGIGIHTGKKAKLALCPAPPNSGIVFKRTDLDKNNLIYPNYLNVINTTLCTTISNEFGVKVSTIEHLMGALYGIGVDNVTVEIDSEEVPILDGSANIFVEKIKNVGLKASDQPIKIIKIDKEVKVNIGEKFISINKSNITCDIEFEIKYMNNLIRTQKNKINVFETDLKTIFESRTFCLFEDIEKLKKLNLGKGGSLENAIVIKDCMGDMYLSGHKIIGSLKCSQGGHELTNLLLRKLFSDRSNYSFIEIKGKQVPHIFNNYQFLKSIA